MLVAMSDPSGLGPVLLVPLVVIAAGLIIAFSRKGSVASTQIGARRLELTSVLDPAAVFERITQIGGRYKVDDASPVSLSVILSTSPTLVTWGFFFPVVIQPAGNGARIEIGIQSRLFQWGPVVTHAHKRCAAEIERALALPAARIAR